MRISRVGRPFLFTHIFIYKILSDTNVYRWDARIRVYEYKGSKGRILAVLKYHEMIMTSVRFSPDGKFLASASRDGSVALWPIFPQVDANDAPHSMLRERADL